MTNAQIRLAHLQTRRADILRNMAEFNREHRGYMTNEARHTRFIYSIALQAVDEDIEDVINNGGRN